MSAIPSGALVDASGSITLGGTAQQLLARDVSRQYLLIQNISIGDLWINFGVTAVLDQPSIKLKPDASIELSAAGTGVVPTSTVSIIGATTGQKWVAKVA